MKILFLSFFIFFSANKMFSQEISIAGKQIILNGNIQYIGKSIYVSQSSKIQNYIGTKTSFSLRIQNVNKYQFYYKKGRFYPPIDSVVIEPGMYSLYPDLPDKMRSISVKVVLVPLK